MDKVKSYEIQKQANVFKTSFKNERGFILIATYTFITILSVFSMATYSRSVNYMQDIQVKQSRLSSFNMAETAVEMALNQLKTDNNYLSGSGTTGYVDFSSGDFQGGYEITVSTPVGQPNVRMIEVIGHSPSNDTSHPHYTNVSITTYGETPADSIFPYSVFAEGKITMSGNAEIDSYNSDLGAYGGGNVGSNGNAGTNRTGSRSIDMSGNAEINGSANVGFGGNSGSDIRTTGNAVINGSSGELSALRVLPVPSTSVPTSGQLKISGNSTVSLTAGTYHYSKLQITGNGALETLGDVTIYVTGRVTISGNGVLAFNSVPSNLKVYVTSGDRVQVSGNGDLVGAIYAPFSRVDLSGNGDIYGAIVGDTINISGNGNIHYDEALSGVSMGGGGSTFEMLTWIQENNVSWDL